jgi:nicotinate-nucleotide pyrophosphorylase (carboxylating)
MEHELQENERSLIRMAIAEDLGAGDLTSIATIPPNARGTGRIRAKERLVLAGLPYARGVFEEIDPAVDFENNRAEGSLLEPGDVAATISGPMRSLLAGERLALNLLQRLSGIATLTNRFAEAVTGAGAQITDTRKTTPGWRIAEKYAVRIGGGINHRMGLDDMVLIKDNHIEANVSLGEAVRKAKSFVGQGAPILVEIRAEQEIEAAIEAGATRLLLDNMDIDQIARCVRLAGKRVLVEASGSVTLDNVREIALTGVDFISIGAITHSAPAVDMNLKIHIIRE